MAEQTPVTGLVFDKEGMIILDGLKYIQPHRMPFIERGPLDAVRGIIIHQTGTATGQQVFNTYGNPHGGPEGGGPMGAHFLIDENGYIFQSASVYRQTMHVGKIKARCLAEFRCDPTELPNLEKWTKKQMAKPIYDNEKDKAPGDRYPMNEDSIGIEIVGLPENYKVKGKEKYGACSPIQQTSLNWLMSRLKYSFGQTPITEVFAHITIAWKSPGEGEAPLAAYKKTLAPGH